MTTIQELHAMVWKFRQEMEHYFPTPSPANSLAFAFTEVGEAVDAQLRQNPLYKRNTAKSHTVESELAQCAMMLLTAVPELPMIYQMESKHALPEIAHAISVAYLLASSGQDEPKLAIYAAMKIANLIDLPFHLAAELDRMRTKHGPVRDDGPASLNEPTNEHYIYTDRMERLVINREGFLFYDTIPADNSQWDTEPQSPKQFTADDAGEWVTV